MNDDEIRTKPLSNWKPETDIKLQKAFGKFVEEVGELVEIIAEYSKYTWSLTKSLDQMRSELEEEIADCEACIGMIEFVSTGSWSPILNCYVDAVDEFSKQISPDSYEPDALNLMSRQIGKTLSIVGRCQIQGLAGISPSTKEPNTSVLGVELVRLRAALHIAISKLNLSKERINKRREAKIDTKLPWVTETATDLLPDYKSLTATFYPVGSTLVVTLKKPFVRNEWDFTIKILEWREPNVDGLDVRFRSSDDFDHWYASSEYWVVRSVDKES